MDTMSDYEMLLRQERRSKMWVLYRSRADNNRYVCTKEDYSDILNKNAINNGRVLLKKNNDELVVRYVIKRDEADRLERDGYGMLRIVEFKALIIMESEEEKMVEMIEKEKTEKEVCEMENNMEKSKKECMDEAERGNSSSGNSNNMCNELIEKTISDLDKKIVDQRDIVELLKQRYKQGWRIFYSGVRFDYSNKKAVKFEILDPEITDDFSYTESCWTQTFEDMNYNGINISKLIDYSGFVLSEVQLLRYEMTKLLPEIRFKDKEYDVEDDKNTLILDFYDCLSEVLKSKDNKGNLRFADCYIISTIAGEPYLIIKSQKFNHIIYKELEPLILFDGKAKNMIDLLQSGHVLKEMPSRKRTIPVANYFNSCYCISIKRIDNIRKMVTAYESEKPL